MNEETDKKNKTVFNNSANILGWQKAQALSAPDKNT